MDNISPSAGFVKGAGKRSVPNLMGEPNIDDGLITLGNRLLHFEVRLILDCGD